MVREMAWALLATRNDPGPTVARVALGGMILAHGLLKVFGTADGGGFRATMDYFTGALGIPWGLALVAIATEVLGGLGLLLGLCGRMAALGVGIHMIVAARVSHAEDGFFMNWFGNEPAGVEGWEFHLLAVALALVVFLGGSGAASLDRRMVRVLSPNGTNDE